MSPQIYEINFKLEEIILKYSFIIEL